MTARKIELRKISYSKSLSQETNAYTADLYVDGRLLAHVSNQGFGGCDMQHAAKGRNQDEVDELNAWIKSTYPAQTSRLKNPDGSAFMMDLELVCNNLLMELLITKDLTRLLKRTIVFYDGTAIRSYKGKAEGIQRAHLVTQTLRQNPKATILNNLPFDEALALFRAAA